MFWELNGNCAAARFYLIPYSSLPSGLTRVKYIIYCLKLRIFLSPSAASLYNSYNSLSYTKLHVNILPFGGNRDGKLPKYLILQRC